MNKRSFTQTEFNRSIESLSKLIISKKEQWYPDIVVGLARGGLIPAVCLSHKLSVPLYTLKWTSSNNFAKGFDFDQILSLVKDGKKILFVDDLIDSGESFKKLFEELDENMTLESCRISVLLYNIDVNLTDLNKKIKGYSAHYFSKEKDPRWVDFWWEI